MKRRARHLLPTGMTLLLGFLVAGCADPGRGREIYVREKCGSCHRFRGEGGSLAPDLTAVAGRRPDAWIERQIVSPEKNNPRHRMPSYPHLSRSEVRALLAYLKS